MRTENPHFLEQIEYMKKVRPLAAEIYGEPKACVNTFGCQQNVSDSEHYKGMLVEMGYTLTDNPEEADFVLFNTCAVREHAEDRVYGNIGTMKRLKAARKNMIIAVCGCMGQQQKVADRIKKSYPYVDIVFGTQVLHRLPEFIFKRLSGGPRIFNNSTEVTDIVEGIPVSRDRAVKGWLPIMYGCNNFCTYCIVPYVRGRERSRKSCEIIREAKEMIAAGIRDITLLGQNVNSYGKTLDEDINFSGLLRKINALEGDFRIRFMTSHPRDCTEELLRTMAECEKVCHQLHLPFQSGNSRVLRAMNRHYDRDKYLSLAKKAKELMPDIVLTSDVIVGFPGETYEEFCDTVSLVKEVRYNSLFTFIFSPRPGTPAEAMPDNISRAEKGRWFDELLAVQDEIGKRHQQAMLGKTYRVLCEEETGDGIFTGHTDGNIAVTFKARADDIGKFLNIKITNVNNVLSGTAI